jgi:PAS domain S-box-containing protein
MKLRLTIPRVVGIGFGLMLAFSVIGPTMAYGRHIAFVREFSERTSRSDTLTVLQEIDREARLGEWEFVQDQLRRLSGLEPDSRLLVVAPDGAIWADSERLQPNGRIDEPIVAQALAAESPVTADGDLPYIFSVAVPLFDQAGRPFAVLLNEVNWQADYEQAQSEALFGLAASILGTLLISGVTLAFLWRLVVSPLGQLRRLTEQVTGGSIAARAPEFRVAELRQVGMALNQMLNRIQTQQVSLESLNANLEAALAWRGAALRASEEALSRDHALLNAVVEGTTDAVFVKDLQGRYLMINAAGARFMGKTLDEIIGQDDAALFSADTARLMMDNDRRVLATGETQTIEEIGTAAGVTRTYLATKGVYRNPRGEPVGLIGISRDITERKQAEEIVRTLNAELEQRVADRTRELVAAYEQLKELDQLKSKFITDVSHELRTPVSNLHLYVSLLERGKPEKQTQYLATLKEQVARLVNLLEDILDVSRLEPNGPQSAVRLVDFNRVVGQVVAALQNRAASAGLTLLFEPDAHLPPVRAISDQLSQAVAHLVTNAINYTPQGEVRVSTHRVDDRIGVQVQDTGAGIDPADLQHLFKRFYRGRSVSHIPGAGLGLALVNEIVSFHGGTIEVDSRLGEGSTFKVWLPADKR